jgi:hypothetical protein
LAGFQYGFGPAAHWALFFLWSYGGVHGERMNDVPVTACLCFDYAIVPIFAAVLATFASSSFLALV